MQLVLLIHSIMLLAIARPEAAWSSRRRSIDASVLAAGPPKVSSRPQDEPIACPHDGAFREVGAVHDVHLSLENQHKLIERRALRKLFCGGAHGRHASRAGRVGGCDAAYSVMVLRISFGRVG